MDRKNGPTDTPANPLEWMQAATGRLIVLPLVLAGAWILETFLFAGWPQVLLHKEPAGLLFYTLMTCIIIGILLPALLMRQAFLRGDVNMHQFGFRSLRRTFLMAGLTLLIVWMAVVLQNPFGANRPGFVSVFLLLLPTGIATAMVCSVLLGTHVQAFVRERGALAAIFAGTVVSALVFALSLSFHFPDALTPASFLRFLSAGVLSALFFFAVRDVWAVSVVATGSLVWLTAGWLEPGQISLLNPAVPVAAAISAGTLGALHWYLSRHYITITAPPGNFP